MTALKAGSLGATGIGGDSFPTDRGTTQAFPSAAAVGQEAALLGSRGGVWGRPASWLGGSMCLAGRGRSLALMPCMRADHIRLSMHTACNRQVICLKPGSNWLWGVWDGFPSNPVDIVHRWVRAHTPPPCAGILGSLDLTFSLGPASCPSPTL